MSQIGLGWVRTEKTALGFTLQQLSSLSIAFEHSWVGVGGQGPPPSREQGEKSDAGLFLSVDHFL